MELKREDPEEAKELLERIKGLLKGPVRFMEVCGTHTVSIFRSGIKAMLPPQIDLISGPGCPVCVTPPEEIKRAMELALNGDVALVTFGDLMKVPVGGKSLEHLKAEGADVRVVLSPLDALQIALREPKKRVVFFAVGFETTAPAVAATVLEAKRQAVKNFFVLSAQRLIPPAIRALLEGGKVLLDGFILPGHVSVIIGKEPYGFIAREFRLPAVITGFEPLDVLESIWMLLEQRRRGLSQVLIQYRRAVRPEGNLRACSLVEEVFCAVDARWRGLGVIPQSGLKLRKGFSLWDAERAFGLLPPEPIPEPAGCSCGEVLQGLKKPPQCKLFGKVCTPSSPIGPCMVSSEGSCAAYYKYGGRDGQG